jgi:hypothetical protein
MDDAGHAGSQRKPRRAGLTVADDELRQLERSHAGGGEGHHHYYDRDDSAH